MVVVGGVVVVGRRHRGLTGGGWRQVLGLLAVVAVGPEQDEGQDPAEDDHEGHQPPLRAAAGGLRFGVDGDRWWCRRRGQGVLGRRQQRSDRGRDDHRLARVGLGALLEGDRQRGDRHAEGLLGAAQGLTELGGGGVALGRVLGHPPADDPGEGRRHPDGAQVRRGLREHPVHHRERALVGRLHKRRRAGQELVQGRRQAVDVAGRAGGSALERLGGGVGGGAGHHAAGGQVGAALEAGDAEVGQDGLTEGRHQNVLGLDVAVQDPGPVGRLEGARHLHPDVGHLGPRDRAPGPQAVTQRPGGLVAHDQVRQALGGLPRPVDGDDVRVLGQGADGLELLFEAVSEPLVDPGHGDDLDRHVPGEGRLATPVDHGHAAAADLGEVLDPRDLHRHYCGARARRASRSGRAPGKGSRAIAGVSTPLAR